LAGASLFVFAPLERKMLFVKLLSLVILYTFFQGLNTLRQANVVGYTTYNSFYYGSSFPIFLLLALSPLLAVGREQIAWARWTAYLFLPYLFVAGLANWVIVNNGPKTSLEPSYPPQWTTEYPGVQPGVPLTFQKTLTAWRSAKAGQSLADTYAQFAISDLWLFKELEFTFASRKP
jgi:hypothetical protein